MKKYLVFLILLASIGCTKTQTDYTETDHTIIMDYIASHHLTAQAALNAQSISTGMYYVIEKPGSISKPNYYSTVTVNYKGQLANDTIFDTTIDKSPAILALAQTVVGWQIGVPLIGRGGKIKLLIPSALGYSYQPKGSIPANSVLIFDIELKDFY